MKHRYYPILLLYFFQAACMPEEDLPIRHTGETPEYFIECYCQPGRPFALSATSVLPVSEDLQIDFSKEMKVTIHADKAISLIHTLYTLPGSEFIYNYGSPEKFEVRYIDSLFLDITTIDNKSITASTSIPPAVSIYNCQVAGNEAPMKTITFIQQKLSMQIRFSTKKYVIWIIVNSNRKALLKSPLSFRISDRQRKLFSR